MSLLTRLGSRCCWRPPLPLRRWRVTSFHRAFVQGLVAFASDEGMSRLARSPAKVDFPALANQFEAQTNSMFCGPTTAAIVLNAVRARSSDLPRDSSRLRADDLRYIPGASDPTIPRFTRITSSPRREDPGPVMGEPMTVNGKQIRTSAFSCVSSMNCSSKRASHPTRHRRRQKVREGIRTDLVDNLKRRGDYVVVNYRRETAGQQGGGHISPLAAYDPESDSFLVLDVNPASAGWVWMPASTLVKGMRTFDKVENAGISTLSRAK